MKARFFTPLNFRLGTQAEFKFGLFCSLVGLFLLLFIFSAHASAHNHKAKVASDNNMAALVDISEPWARATFALAKTGAAYFSVTNIGSTTVLIESVSLKPDIAMVAELHHTVMEDEMMRMQELSEGIKINSGETIEFSPGGKHIMIMGLEGPLQKGASIIITLHFEDGSSKDQLFPILDKRN